MNASQQIADFAANAPLQAWLVVALVAAFLLAGFGCIAAGLYLEATRDWRRNRSFRRRVRRAVYGRR